MSDIKILITRGLQGEFLGGAELEIIDIASAARKHQGNKVSFMLISNSSKLLEKIAIKNKKLLLDWPIRSKGAIKYIYNLYRLTRELRLAINILGPDIIIAQSREDFIAASIAKKRHKIPVVLRDHGDLRHQLIKSRRNILATLFQKLYVSRLKSASLIFVHTEHEKRYLESFFDGNFKLLPSGIKISEPMPKTKVKKEVDKIAVVSRLEKGKGIECFIKAVSLLSQRLRLKQKFVIIGGGSRRLELEQLAQGLPIEFLGHLGNRQLIYSNIDILVQPSESEGWGRTVSEGMYYGIPIIASDIYSYRTQLSDNCGILFRNRDCYDLADKLIKLIDDYATRVRLSKNAQRKIRNIANIDILFENTFMPPLINLLNKK